MTTSTTLNRIDVINIALFNLAVESTHNVITQIVPKNRGSSIKQSFSDLKAASTVETNAGGPLLGP
jgi:RNA polymerase II subunit A small phosphatase-like protein